MTATQNKLNTLFNIHPGEGKLVSLLLAYSFFIGAARIFTRSAAMGLFLDEYSAGALPYVYIGISIIVTALSYIYLKLGQKLALSRLLAASLVFLLASLLLFWGGLRLSQSSALVFVLPIWYEVLWTLTSLAFWNLAGRLFNVRQGKRLFAFASSGEAVAILLGGLLVPVLVQLGSTADLFFAAAVSVFCILIVLAVISRSYSHQLNVPLEKASTKAAGSIKTVFKSHYVLLLCGLFGMAVLVYFFVDAIFYAQAEIRYPTQESLTAFVGVFFGIIGFLGLLTRLVATGWMINRFGVRITALVGPVVVAILVALLALAGSFSTLLVVIFGLASLAKMFNLLLFDSTDAASLNIFYQPLAPARRTQVQTLVEGIVYPLAVGLAGVGLVLFTTALSLGILTVVYITLLLVLVWLSVAVATGRKYPAALRQALVKRKISGEGLVLDDESSRKVLIDALQSDKPITVLHALTMLEESESGDLAIALPELLEHSSPEVRLAALRIIERQHVVTATEAVQHCMQNEANASVQAVALRVLASLGRDEAIEQIYPYLEDADLEIRSEAIVALLRYTGIAVAIMAEGKLLQLAVSTSSTERITAAKIIGRVSGRNLDHLLTQLLADEYIQVRRAALAAAGQSNYPNVWPLVINELATSQLRNAAAAALVSGGVSTLPNISVALDDSHLNSDTRRRLVRVMGRIGGQEATGILLNQLPHPDPQFRTEVFAALHRCGYRASGEGHAAVVNHINSEAEQATSTLAALVDFQQQADENNPGFSLLADGLIHQMIQARRRMFWLLSFIYPATTILQARYNLDLGVPEKNAYALEILDLTLSSSLKSQLFPFFEDALPNQQLQRLEKTFPQPAQTTEQHLQTMLSWSPECCNPWIQACAAYAAGQPHQISNSLFELFLSLLQVDKTDSLVLETVLFALVSLQSSPAVDWEKYRGSAQFKDAFTRLDAAKNGGSPMLSTIEKVLILKTVDLFSGTPDEILAEVASLLEEVELLSGDTAFEKGDAGDCMYIIVSGKVKAHDGDHIFNTLQDGDVFGEMAMLDPEPRVASITAVDDTHLLRLDQEPFYELMEDRIEIARGVIHVLSGHLRNRVRDVAELKEQLQSTE